VLPDFRAVRVRHSPEPDIDRHTGATIAEAVENPKNIGP
jgi:hypothetical protein